MNAFIQLLIIACAIGAMTTGAIYIVIWLSDRSNRPKKYKKQNFLDNLDNFIKKHHGN